MDKKKAFWILEDNGGFTFLCYDELRKRESRSKTGQLRRSTVEKVASKYGCSIRWTEIYV